MIVDQHESFINGYRDIILHASFSTPTELEYFILSTTLSTKQFTFFEPPEVIEQMH